MHKNNNAHLIILMEVLKYYLFRTLTAEKKIEEIGIKTIIEHFKNYINPKNMFVLPKELGGLEEVKEFINEQKI